MSSLDAQEIRKVKEAIASSRTRASGLALRLVALSKRFGGRRVLADIDLDVGSGEFMAVVGRSGCGKSTLLRMLAGLDAPTAGEIRLDGQPIASRRGELRIMFQDARLLPWQTIAGNVALGLTGSRPTVHASALAALTHVGLTDRADDWPARLSGGQRQRVALARALVHAPRLLLLDEPLGALDALTRIEMQELIEGLWREQGFTALLVTHDVAEAVALADRILLIEDGAISLDISVDLPRPRARGTAAFAALEDRVLKRVLRRPAPGRLAIPSIARIPVRR